MRDLILTCLIGGMIPFALFRPFVGLLIFSWLAYFRPQELAWTFARDIPFSFIIAGATVLGIILGRVFGPPFATRETFFRVDRRTILLVLLWAALALCSMLAVSPELAWPEFRDVSKVFIFALLTTGLCTTRNRLRWLLMVIAASLGLMALKHGLFAIRTGEFRILKGPGGMMEDNNDFGLALVMTLPLLFYIAITEKHFWVKVGSLFLAVFTVATVFFSHSRGGFLALFVMTIIWVFKFRQKAWALIVAPVVIVVTVLALPSDLIERGRGVLQSNPDASAAYRVVAWEKALNMGLDRPVYGVGPGNFMARWDTYDPPTAHAPITVHNTYLHLLAESGVLGLVLFVGLLVTTIGGLRLLRYRLRDKPEEEWRVNYSHALELSILGFIVGAMFLSRAHFDLIYQMVAMTTALVLAVDRRESAASEFFYWRRSDEAAPAHPGSAVQP